MATDPTRMRSLSNSSATQPTRARSSSNGVEPKQQETDAKVSSVATVTFSDILAFLDGSNPEQTHAPAAESAPSTTLEDKARDRAVNDQFKTLQEQIRAINDYNGFGQYVPSLKIEDVEEMEGQELVLLLIPTLAAVINLIKKELEEPKAPKQEIDAWLLSAEQALERFPRKTIGIENYKSWFEIMRNYFP